MTKSLHSSQGALHGNASGEFEVIAKDGAKAFWIVVDEDDVRLVKGKGSIDLNDKVEHLLMWWFIGDPGVKLAIVGKSGAKTVVEVKESRIPNNRTRGAGFNEFEL